MITKLKALRGGRAFGELLVASRFGLVGLAATAVHLAIITLLIRAGLAPLLANLLAFLCAFGVSFCGHYLWTFRSSVGVSRAIVRFFLIAVGGFLVNSALLALLLRWTTFESTTCALIAVLIVPVLSFLASRLWGFKA
ncbi:MULTISPECIES: GtrA family protein [unclassified Pseudomonas]|uniref:GtrA family protein n=1 Tax=unclassified Pseudomonas TaxID=196821 RepID=UPI00131AC91A|nr:MULTISPECIES: GtrA family protein [unclassified Pseudomonas]